MFTITIVVTVLLVCTGAVLIGLETGFLLKFKGTAVTGVALAIVGTNVLFFMADADGKIGWGDPIEADDGKGGGKKRQWGGGDSDDGDSKITEADAQNGKSGQGEAAGGASSGVMEEELLKKKRKPKDEDTGPAIITFQDCDVCPVMVVVHPGQFVMGSPADELGRRFFEGPQRKIEIPKNFAISRSEITLAQYQSFIDETGHSSANECVVNGMLTAGGNYKATGLRQEGTDPVVCVRWRDAVAYVAWLSWKTSGKYRLLAESEWEYAARANKPGLYSTNGGISKMDANYDMLWKGTMPVQSFPANRFGIHDVHGNVWEWVADCWHDSYAGRPAGPTPWLKADHGDCSIRTIRGGAWDSEVTEIRSATRAYEMKLTAKNNIGIRVAKTLGRSFNVRPTLRDEIGSLAVSLGQPGRKLSPEQRYRNKKNIDNYLKRMGKLGRRMEKLERVMAPLYGRKARKSYDERSRRRRPWSQGGSGR